MEHITSFIILSAIISTTATAAVTLVLNAQYHHKGAMWFAMTLGGLGSFMTEILIYRYANMMKPVMTPLMFETILSFSDFWALAGGVLISYSLPRLARSFSEGSRGLHWTLFLTVSPLLLSGIGLLFLTGIGRPLTGRLLQAVLFLIVILSVAIIRWQTRGEKKEASQRLNNRFAVFLFVTLPLIIMDAAGFPLPLFLNDLTLVVFAGGISLVSLYKVHTLFGSSSGMSPNGLSQKILDRYSISPREKDVIEQVGKGHSNSIIGQNLFISQKTVENHLTSIFRKLKVKNRMELFRFIHLSPE